ncbi:hypothetical protein ACWGIU_21940, partial [Streptomyces sp. NPDC054840]
RVETDLGCVEAIGGRPAEAAERFRRARAAFGEVGAQPWRAQADRLLAAVQGASGTAGEPGGGGAGALPHRSFTAAELTLLLTHPEG